MGFGRVGDWSKDVNESVIGQVKGRKQIGDWSKDVVVKVLGVRIEPK